ncbi:hypothetical protein MMIC_P1974 [Mariprofundus micogutta]|uniref:DUF1761 domain-containing protein n=1 Tax=Mariprofundus micogutta TaxID=1921010 RepID=A0A1L8CPZ4_9PROT|nr:hypothetical protein [Mariprofundus micogutta]GAV20995.1 hypothetical protein MMIC_P1974 [Mariprofundus micogutta]
MFCSCFKRPNAGRLLLAMLAVAVFVFVFEWLFHGIYLADTYQATASLWRSQAEMEAHMGWMMGGQLLMAAVFSYLYSFVRTCGGIGGGACYGLIVGLLMVSPQLITYAVQPVPGSLVATWMIGGLIELILAGMLVAAIYRHD